MKTLNEIDFESVDGDTLGDAYEYLIGEFASESGKKAGEFYTPQAVSHLMTQIVFSGREDQKGMTLYDPAMESGTLLLNAKNIVINQIPFLTMVKKSILLLITWLA